MDQPLQMDARAMRPPARRPSLSALVIGAAALLAVVAGIAQLAPLAADAGPSTASASGREAAGMARSTADRRPLAETGRDETDATSAIGVPMP